jgi:hypothetical protein
MSVAQVVGGLEETPGSVREAAHQDQLEDGVREPLGPGLRHHGDPCRDGRAREPVKALAAEEDLAPRRDQDLGQEADERGLARGIGPDHAEDLRVADREGEVPDGEGRPPAGTGRVGEIHAAELDERRHGPIRVTRERRR